MRNRLQTAVMSLMAAAAFLCTGAQAQNVGLGNATRYDATVRNVELCVAGCAQTYPVPGNPGTYDIGSAPPNGNVGNFGSIPGGIPIGTLLTNVRVTVSPNVPIIASGRDDAGNNCFTDSTQSGATPTLAARAKTTPPATLETLVVPNVGAFAGRPTAAEFAARFAETLPDGNIRITYPLNPPYRIKAKPPNVTIKFDLQGSVSFFVGPPPSLPCSLAFPNPPGMTVTISD